MDFKFYFLQAVIAVGGSQEVVHAKPGNYRIVLQDRKGFIRIALQTGAAVVPVISFGENDLYHQLSNEPDSLSAKVQTLIRKAIGITLPIVQEVIPRRHSITTVVGAPLEVKQNAEPSREEINALHDEFINALSELFEDHKHNYIENSDNVRLIIT